jgi:rhodanese-related sulfurtransferase
MKKSLWAIIALVAITGIGFVGISAVHGTTASGAAASPDANGVPNDNLATVRALIANGAVILDVRTDAEWAAGHVPGSVHIPLAQVQDRYAELSRGRTVVAVCRTGGRSYKAAFALRQLGYNAVNLAGGLKVWVDAGLPLVDANGGPGHIAFDVPLVSCGTSTY